MKFTAAALLAALTVTCYAQRVKIGSPANGTSVSPGSNLVVQVDRPESLTPSTEVGIAIGIFSCTVCPLPGQALGTILFNGPFNPQLPLAPSTGPPQQNFTVTIPSTFPQGPAELSVFHAALIGVDNMALAETVNVTLNVT